MTLYQLEGGILSILLYICLLVHVTLYQLEGGTLSILLYICLLVM